jgi:hypothetical protein
VWRLNLDLGLGSVGPDLLVGTPASLVVGGVSGGGVLGFFSSGTEVTARLGGKGGKDVGIGVVVQDECDSVHGVGIIPGEEEQE